METVKEKGMQSQTLGLHVEINQHSHRLLHAWLSHQAKISEHGYLNDQFFHEGKDLDLWKQKVMEELDGIYTLCDEPTEKMRSLLYRMSISFAADPDNCVDDLELVMMQVMFNVFNVL